MLPEEVQTQILETKKRVTLKEFINDNDKLITAIGVMGALAALFTTVKNAEILAFSAFTMLLVLDFELLMCSYRIRSQSETLIVFQGLFQIFLIFVGVFLANAYPNYIEWLLTPMIIGIAIGWLALRLGRRIKNRKTKKPS